MQEDRFKVGFAHFNQIYGTVMREHFTPDRVCDVLHQCNRFGINAFNCYPGARSEADLERFQAEGGNMYRVLTGNGSRTTTELVELAVRSGVEVRSLTVQNTTLDDVFVHYTGRQLRDEQVKAFAYTGMLFGSEAR